MQLDHAGYTTGYIGKYFNPYGGRELQPYVPPGWDEWYGLTRPWGYLRTPVFTQTRTLRLDGYQTDEYGKLAREFIADHAARPFFLSVTPSAPHTGSRLREGKGAAMMTVPAPRHQDLYQDARLPGPRHRMPDKPRWLARLPGVDRGELRSYWRDYLASLRAVDEMVVGIRAELRAQGVADETVVFLTSDNGYLFGEHGLSQKDLPYEPSARIPLVAWGPGFKGGRELRKLTANIDLPVTIAHLARVSLPDADGRSLRGTARRYLLLEGGGGQGAPAWRAVLTRSGEKLIDWEGRSEELYDLRRDPHELRSIDGRRGEKARLARIAGQLAALP